MFKWVQESKVLVFVQQALPTLSHLSNLLFFFKTFENIANYHQWLLPQLYDRSSATGKVQLQLKLLVSVVALQTHHSEVKAVLCSVSLKQLSLIKTQEAPTFLGWKPGIKMSRSVSLGGCWGSERVGTCPQDYTAPGWDWNSSSESQCRHLH